MLWIDYGDQRGFHLGTPASQRVFAGPPRSRASVYRDPGRDDITFFVDFSVVEAAARAARLRVKRYGGQGELARRSGVRLDRNAADEIARWHALTWLLALSGVGPERAWQHTGLTWASTRRRRRLQVDARRAVDEFFGRRPTTFKLMILRTQT